MLIHNYSDSFLFAFSIVSKTAIKSTKYSFTGKYAILTSTENDDFRTKFSFTQMIFSLDVRPKGVCTYVLRGYGRTCRGRLHVRPWNLWSEMMLLYG